MVDNNTEILYDKFINEIKNQSFSFNILPLFFVDFIKLLFYQNQILVQNLENKLGILSKYLTIFNGENFISFFKENISFYKICQSYDNLNRKFILSLKEEKINFIDFLLLSSSRCAILTKDINDLKNPIYFLNKPGNDSFKNVFSINRLNSYQENIYLLILDCKNLSTNLLLILNKIEVYLSSLKRNLKSIIYYILNINLIIIIFIIAIIFGYILIYFIIIFKIIQNIYNNLNEKLGDTIIKDILKKKIDNLNLLLSFYEYDINNTINDLNNIYSDYKESYNFKIKEESKTSKKEGKNEDKDKNINCFELFKERKKFNLFKYSGRKNTYLYGFYFLIIICLSLYSISLVIWILFFRKEQKVDKWDSLTNEVIFASNQLMNNLLIMLYKNQSLEEFAQTFRTKDYFGYIYTNLTKLYFTQQYLESMRDYLLINDLTMNYNCLDFYQNLNEENFIQLKNKFINEKEKFFFTMNSFCNTTNIMIFNNYKAIYLQLFNQIKIIMENFINNKYNDVIEFINKSEIVKIEIIYLIIYSYLISVMYENNRNTLKILMATIANNIIITGIIFLSMFFFLIFIIYFVYVRNVNKDTIHFIYIKKVFKICNINE